jgi:hypothetical protein
MYFNLLPDIKYGQKPISYPFGESDFVVAKNLFRRFKLSEDFKQYAVYFQKYRIADFEQPWFIAEQVYGSPYYDWVLLLTNNIVNPLFDWPMESNTLRKYIEGKYEDPYASIKYYKTNEIKDTTGIVVQKAGMIVDETFYNSPEYIVDTTSILPQQNLPKQAKVTLYSDSYAITGLQLFSNGAGYESAPEVVISGTGTGAVGETTLAPSGYIKRIRIISSGFGYSYPPIVTLGGGLAGQSATAEIINGMLSNIILDGIKFDTTDASQIYEFGGGTSIAPNGTGTGSNGGFDIGSTHLRFGDSSGTRFVTLNPVNATSINKVRVYAVRGNGSNGGETPDVVGVEDLRIQYQVTDPGVAPNNNEWNNLGIVIDAVTNGTGTGVLDNYDFDLGTEVQQPHVYFRLYQEGNSGANFDHYGILSVNFIGATATNITDSTITLTTNPLETSEPSVAASAEVIIGKPLAGITLTSAGLNYGDGTTTTIQLVGGNPDVDAVPDFLLGTEFKANVIEGGSAYNNASVSFIGGGIGNGGDLAANVNISNGRIVGLNFTNFGTDYTDAPQALISAPDAPVTFSVGDGYTDGLNAWKWNGGQWERQVTFGLRYYDTGTMLNVSVPGNVASYPVSVFEYEDEQNEKSREIFLLKPRYLEEFVREFRKQSKYTPSSDFISGRLKKTGV